MARRLRRWSQLWRSQDRRLRALEEAVGQTLFQRTGDGFVLTDEGEAVPSHAERMEEEALAVECRLAGEDQQLEDLLRVSSSDWFGAHLLAPVLAEFSGMYPKVVVELLTSHIRRSLPRREADMVFRIRPFDEPEVISRRLMTIRYGTYLKGGLDHPVRGDGVGMTLITMDTQFAGMPDAVWLRTILPNARVASRSNNRDVQARMCSYGAGVAALPRPLEDSLAGITRIDLGEEPPSRETFVGYHRDLKKLARLRPTL